MEKKLLFKIIGITVGVMIVLMFVVPVIVNALMFISVAPVASNEAIWISALSSIWGSIINGVIAGTLTLLGVSFTILASFNGLNKTLQHQENEKFKELIGAKLNNLFKVKRIIFELAMRLENRKYSRNEKFEKVEDKEIEQAILRYILPNFNVLLELSSSVDYEFYNEIQEFVSSARGALLGEEYDFDSLTSIVDDLTISIEQRHERRLGEKFKIAST